MRSSRFMRRAMAAGGLSLPAFAMVAGITVGTSSAHVLPAAHQATTPAAVPQAPAASYCPANLGVASTYNEFSFGDANRGQPANVDQEGNVAYGGNATFTGDFFVGTYTGAADAAVIGGNIKGQLTLLSGSTGVYGGTTSQPIAGMTHAQPPFSFAYAQTQLDQTSQQIAADSQTAGATVTPTGTLLYLAGTNATANVFNLSPGQFAAAQTIFIKVPIGSVTLINVPDANLSTTTVQDIQYWDGSAYEAGSQYNSAAVDQVRNSTLFNFSQAAVLNFASAGLAGTFLAPKADVTFNNGHIDGNLIADQINGSFEGEYDPPFSGCQTTPPGCPTSGGLTQASGYNEFSFGDATRGKASGDDNEGNVAYGGNATFTGNFLVGTYTGAKDAAVVGGNITGNLILDSGSTGVYGGTTSQPIAGMTHGPVPINFAGDQQQITNNSFSWGQTPQTSGATVTANGGLLYLTGTNPTFNAFDLTAGQFAAAQTIFINVPIGSTVLVNVPDASLTTTTLQDIQYWDGSAYEAGSQYNSPAVDQVRNSTLFNFWNASAVKFQSGQLAGTFVVPNGTFTFNSGQLDGNVIANKIKGNFEGEYDAPFTGCQ